MRARAAGLVPAVLIAALLPAGPTAAKFRTVAVEGHVAPGTGRATFLVVSGTPGPEGGVDPIAPSVSESGGLAFRARRRADFPSLRPGLTEIGLSDVAENPA